MPTRKTSLTAHRDRFVDHAIAAARYRNASEVSREGLRLLERREAEDEAKLARLCAAVDEVRSAVSRGECEDVSDDRLADWLTGPGGTARAWGGSSPRRPDATSRACSTGAAIGTVRRRAAATNR